MDIEVDDRAVEILAAAVIEATKVEFETRLAEGHRPRFRDVFEEVWRTESEDCFVGMCLQVMQSDPRAAGRFATGEMHTSFPQTDARIVDLARVFIARHAADEAIQQIQSSQRLVRRITLPQFLWSSLGVRACHSRRRLSEGTPLTIPPVSSAAPTAACSMPLALPDTSVLRARTTIWPMAIVESIDESSACRNSTMASSLDFCKPMSPRP